MFSVRRMMDKMDSDPNVTTMDKVNVQLKLAELELKQKEMELKEQELKILGENSEIAQSYFKILKKYGPKIEKLLTVSLDKMIEDIEEY